MLIRTSTIRASARFIPPSGRDRPCRGPPEGLRPAATSSAGRARRGQIPRPPGLRPAPPAKAEASGSRAGPDRGRKPLHLTRPRWDFCMQPRDGPDQLVDALLRVQPPTTKHGRPDRAVGEIQVCDGDVERGRWPAPPSGGGGIRRTGTAIGPAPAVLLTRGLELWPGTGRRRVRRRCHPVTARRCRSRCSAIGRRSGRFRAPGPG